MGDPAHDIFALLSMTLPMNRREMLRLTTAAAVGLYSPHGLVAGAAQEGANSDILLDDGTVSVLFVRNANSLKIGQIQHKNSPALLYSDEQLRQPGAGFLGNPLAIIIRSGTHQGTYQLDSFYLTHEEHSSRQLLAYFHHQQVPMQFGMEVSIEGNVIGWRGQLIWNGPDDTEVDCYFPLLSRIRFESATRDRLVAGELSGSEKGPTGAINYSSTYIGGLSSPVYLVEGGGRGLGSKITAPTSRRIREDVVKEARWSLPGFRFPWMRTQRVPRPPGKMGLMLAGGTGASCWVHRVSAVKRNTMRPKRQARSRLLNWGIASIWALCIAISTRAPGNREHSGCGKSGSTCHSGNRRRSGISKPRCSRKRCLGGSYFPE